MGGFESYDQIFMKLDGGRLRINRGLRGHLLIDSLTPAGKLWDWCEITPKTCRALAAVLVAEADNLQAEYDRYHPEGRDA